jgi:hypothetical protein
MKVTNPRVLNFPDADNSKAWGYFDGASQGTPGICGAGGIFFCQKIILFHLNWLVVKVQTLGPSCVFCGCC